MLLLTSSVSAREDKAYEKYLSKEKTLIVSLKTTLQMALDQSLSLDLQQYSVQDAKDKLLKNTSEFLPSLSLIQTLSQRDGHFQIFGNQVIPIRQQSVYPRLTANIGLFEGGRVLFGWISGKNSLEAEKAYLEEAEQNILVQATNSYFALQRYSKELESEISRLNQAKQNLQDRKTALELGDDIRLSVTLAEQEVEEAKARIAILKGQFYAESSNLNQILNLSSNILIIPLNSSEEPKEIIANFPEIDLNRLINKAIQVRPDLKAREYAIKAQRAKQIQSVSAFLPNVQLVGNLGLVGPDYNSLYGDEQLALTMQYDILRNLGLGNFANYQQAKHNRERLEIELLQTIKELESNLAALYTAYLSGKENLEASQAALNSAEESHKQALIRLKEGIATPYELTIAQTSLERARSNYYSSEINYRLAQVNLLKGLGLINVQSLTEGVKL